MGLLSLSWGHKLSSNPRGCWGGGRPPQPEDLRLCLPIPALPPRKEAVSSQRPGPSLPEPGALSWPLTGAWSPHSCHPQLLPSLPQSRRTRWPSLTRPGTGAGTPICTGARKGGVERVSGRPSHGSRCTKWLSIFRWLGLESWGRPVPSAPVTPHPSVPAHPAPDDFPDFHDTTSCRHCHWSGPCFCPCPQQTVKPAPQP